MFCSSCGKQIPDHISFCNFCGQRVQQASSQPQITQNFQRSSQFNPQPTPMPQQTSRGQAQFIQNQFPPPYNLRGFSVRIKDPFFESYIKKSNKSAAIFSFILAAVAIIGFFIAGEMGVDGVENPTGLFIGLALGAMFILIAVFQIASRKPGKSWDGVVENKIVKKKTDYKDDYVEEYLEYRIEIRSDQGKKHVIKTHNNDLLYNYFNMGDRVRYHGGLKTYEKFDKTHDKYILCNACLTMNDIRSDYCSRCKAPLLK